MWPCGRRGALVGGLVSLGMGFEVAKGPFQVQSLFFLLPVDQL